MISIGQPPGSSGQSEMRWCQGLCQTSSAAWIVSYEADDEDEDERRLLNPPPQLRPSHHNSNPSDVERRISRDGFVSWADPRLESAPHRKTKVPTLFKHGRAEGRKWDHLRTAEPVIVSRYVPRTQQRTEWSDFFRSSRRPPSPNEVSTVVDIETLNKLQPNFNERIDVPSHTHDRQARSRRERAMTLYRRLWKMIIRHSLVPLASRLAVMLTSIIALAIAGTMLRLLRNDPDRSTESGQAIAAAVVDSVAIPYIAFMIKDEYTGKPLGLRPASAKIGLILLDLFFIVFKSASTALAFEVLIHHNIRDADATMRQLSKALTAFMVLGLVAWISTFIINIFRAVERLGGGENETSRV
ncbi:Uncharacterized protein SAPIO_CDS7348 [Scedosporium apiospermum]|uniref:Regulator of phospholipase D SRF1 n=1 Tax=Pseudallescheria apiosperma TaxID=563466 RepID=A0A084G1P6_PSEDA|nr:Uncharacterized protein SAPIO_CDS7348 [Scedosporium apiospermum]KEZ41258.1 Uncharacterized protein SAPIO_CDS7348 [Scedosporium apiospermum]